MAQFRSIEPRENVSEHEGGESPPAHRHQNAYAAIVLEGAYWETSADGPVWVNAGDIVIHPPFHQHKNRFEASRTRVLNIALPFMDAFEAGYCVAAAPETAQFTVPFEDNSEDMATLLIDSAVVGVRRRQPASSPLDYAADALREDPSTPIAALARRVGYAHAHFTRAFADRYGAPPTAFRAEHRFRAALRRLLGAVSLAEAASGAGYADQAHMTRDFQRRAGLSPAALRRKIKFVQD